MRPLKRELIVIGFLCALAPRAVAGQAASSPGPQDPSHGAMAAASGVARADGGKGPHEPRLIPLRPMAGDVELLYGDPEVPGQAFVMRIRELPGTKVPPHSHPVDEHITILQGSWHFAIGPEFRLDALQELKTGSYAFAPKGSTMFAYSPDGAIVQVHGVGPFRIHWKAGLRTLDDPQPTEAFRFRKGQQVTAPNGSGSIVQGYASGAIVQYEIADAAGRRFMADEAALAVR